MSKPIITEYRFILKNRTRERIIYSQASRNRRRTFYSIANHSLLDENDKIVEEHKGKIPEWTNTNEAYTRVEFIKNSERGRIRSQTLRTYLRQKSIQSCPSIATRFLKFQSKTRERLSTRVISAFNVALNVSIHTLKTFLLFETETRRDIKIRESSEDLYTCLRLLTSHFYTNNWFKSSMRNNSYLSYVIQTTFRFLGVNAFFSSKIFSAIINCTKHPEKHLSDFTRNNSTQNRSRIIRRRWTDPVTQNSRISLNAVEKEVP